VFRREWRCPSTVAGTIPKGCRNATRLLSLNATLVGMLRPSGGPAAIVATCALTSLLSLAACGDDGVESNAERFCGEATNRRDMIVSPPMATEEEVEATLDFYRLMGQLAPVAIAEQWNDIVNAMETASTIAPGDPSSEQQVALQAYATERSAYEVAVWLKRNCAVDIPITTIAPQDAVPARTTTTTLAEGAATTAASG
jgi:hypothetical protein